MSEEKKRAVVALGGNAIIQQDQEGTYEEQMLNVRETTEVLGDMILSGDYQFVITHGNGPQVGAILLQNEAGESEGVPALPMDACGAQSQGLIGYMIQQCLGDIFREADREDISVATVVTQTIVDKNDSAFENPSKPVGPFYEEREAKKLAEEKDWTVINDAGRGWRRVVPSPDPEDLAESGPIKELLGTGIVPIVSGGGGIPVVREGDNLKGVEAVIDKDLAAEKVAETVDADSLVILTDVNGVAINYNEPDEEWLDEISVKEAKKYMKEGHFSEGSMKPKVLAGIRFIESGGKEAIISSLDKAKEAFEGESGTRIIK
ncbi:MAG: carbamate kinase [Hadesarchaea archaeon]|nr:carbamate kinase [Hadesarchaea archaeon]